MLGAGRGEAWRGFSFPSHPQPALRCCKGLHQNGYLDGHTHISKYTPHVERALWSFHGFSSSQRQLRLRLPLGSKLGAGGTSKGHQWQRDSHTGTTDPCHSTTLGQRSEMEKQAGACGAEDQSILPVPVSMCSHLIHNPPTLSHLSHPSDGTGQPPACPAHAGHAGSPPWGEAGGSREASWEKGVSCSFREDLYSLLIDFFAYSPTGAALPALLIFCTPLGTGPGFQRCTVAKISVC